MVGSSLQTTCIFSSGVTLEGGKRYAQTVEKSFHISMAALEPQRKKGHAPSGWVQGGRNYIGQTFTLNPSAVLSLYVDLQDQFKRDGTSQLICFFYCVDSLHCSCRWNCVRHDQPPERGVSPLHPRTRPTVPTATRSEFYGRRTGHVLPERTRWVANKTSDGTFFGRVFQRRWLQDIDMFIVVRTSVSRGLWCPWIQDVSFQAWCTWLGTWWMTWWKTRKTVTTSRTAATCWRRKRRHQTVATLPVNLRTNRKKVKRDDFQVTCRSSRRWRNP